jgi:hypothetical protein
MGFRANFSRQILIRLVIMLFLLLIGLTFAADFLHSLYLDRQLTVVGMAINGAIIGLFLLGLVKMILMLIRYLTEEAALSRFLEVAEIGGWHDIDRIPSRRLIAQRYRHLRDLGERHIPVDHGALAAIMLAGESTRLSFPRFISNILILTGVFGTIVSLSIALVGASELLDTMSDATQMGMIIHGMSTALSTTLTAIVCYLFFGYFYMKLTDAQTNLLGGIEYATIHYLLPRFAFQPDQILHTVAGLIEQLRQAAERMGKREADFVTVANRMQQGVNNLELQVEPLRKDIEEIKQILRQGFRLPEGS